MNHIWKYCRLRSVAGIMALAAGIPAIMPLHAQDEPDIPEGYPVERYQSVWEKSPFTLSSAAEEPVAGFASNLVLVGIGSIDDTFYARVMDKTSQARWSVEEGTPYNGIELIKVDSNADPTMASVRLKKGGEEAVVRYDPQLLTSPAAATPQAGNIPKPPQANQQNANNGNQPRVSSPRNIPTPRRRRIIIPSRQSN